MSTPLNELVRSATEAYLDGIDMDNIPTPRQIEAELLEKVNRSITADNLSRGKRDQLATLKVLTHSQVADVMLKIYRIVRIAPKLVESGDLDRLAIYIPEGRARGIYSTDPDAMRAAAMQLNYQITTGEFREVMATLMVRATTVEVNSDPDIVPMANGLFHQRSKTLTDFTPDVIITSKSPINYIPGSPSPVIHNDEDGTDWDVDSWIRDFANDDPEMELLMWQVLAASLRQYKRWGKMVLLYSEKGNNGKGTFCELARHLIGPNRVAGISIGDFEKDFEMAPLAKASANVCDENDVGRFIVKTAKLKAVVTNDVISLNPKYEKPVALRFWGLNIQCVNEIPRFKDKSDSMYRRMLMVMCLRNFEGIERRYIKDDYVKRREVLEYVAFKALNMDFDEFTIPASCEKMLGELKLVNDPIRQFWEKFEGQFVWDLLPTEFLYQLYRGWYVRSIPSGIPVSEMQFSRDLSKIVDPDRWTDARLRPGSRMSVPEPLILQYDLKEWKNPGYPGKDPDLVCRPLLRDRYRGLVRLGQGCASDDDEDE